jgi:hypothetical protein
VAPGDRQGRGSQPLGSGETAANRENPSPLRPSLASERTPTVPDIKRTGLSGDYRKYPEWKRPFADALAYILPRIGEEASEPWRQTWRYLTFLAGLVTICAVGVMGVLLGVMWGAHRWLNGQIPQGLAISLTIGSFCTMTSFRALQIVAEHLRAKRERESGQRPPTATGTA